MSDTVWPQWFICMEQFLLRITQNVWKHYFHFILIKQKADMFSKLPKLIHLTKRGTLNIQWYKPMSWYMINTNWEAESFLGSWNFMSLFCRGRWIKRQKNRRIIQLLFLYSLKISLRKPLSSISYMIELRKTIRYQGYKKITYLTLQEF